MEYRVYFFAPFLGVPAGVILRVDGVFRWMNVGLWNGNAPYWIYFIFYK